MIHRYIIEATDEVKGFEEAIAKLDREWGIEELEPCEDCVSRQDAVDIINGYAEQFNGYIGTPNDTEVYAYARGLLLGIESNISALPSVKPKGETITEFADRCRECGAKHGELLKSKTGSWIVHPKGGCAHLVCSKCLSDAPFDCKTNFCPNCGSRMIEPQESESDD